MNLFKNKLTIAAIASTMMLAACGDDSSSSASGDEPSNETGDLYLLSFMMETSQGNERHHDEVRRRKQNVR